MSETVISIILLFNIVLLLLFFIMKSHKRAVDKAREELTASTGSEQQRIPESETGSAGEKAPK
jgi:hypothetical protein